MCIAQLMGLLRRCATRNDGDESSIVRIASSLRDSQ